VAQIARHLGGAAARGLVGNSRPPIKTSAELRTAADRGNKKTAPELIRGGLYRLCETDRLCAAASASQHAQSAYRQQAHRRRLGYLLHNEPASAARVIFEVTKEHAISVADRET
jgi:hypothetical protein